MHELCGRGSVLRVVRRVRAGLGTCTCMRAPAYTCASVAFSCSAACVFCPPVAIFFCFCAVGAMALWFVLELPQFGCGCHSVHSLVAAFSFVSPCLSACLAFSCRRCSSVIFWVPAVCGALLSPMGLLLWLFLSCFSRCSWFHCLTSVSLCCVFARRLRRPSSVDYVSQVPSGTALAGWRGVSFSPRC